MSQEERKNPDQSSPGPDEGLASERVLWARFVKDRDPAIREELVRRYLPFAKNLALRYRGASESFDDVEEALDQNTFDELEDRHLSRTPMVVDRQGWEDAAAALAETLDRLIEIQSEATARLGASEEEGMHSKVLMLHFKSPSSTTEPKSPAS